MKPVLCRIPNCKREAKNRGACTPCYCAAAKAVKDGVATWAELEASGLFLPASKRGGSKGPRSPFAVALQTLKQPPQES